MKKILMKIGQVLQVVLAAPVKWPGKARNILKYIAVGLGIVETIIETDKPPPEPSPEKVEPVGLPIDAGRDAAAIDRVDNLTDREAMQQHAERSEGDEME